MFTNQTAAFIKNRLTNMTIREIKLRRIITIQTVALIINILINMMIRGIKLRGIVTF